MTEKEKKRHGKKLLKSLERTLDEVDGLLPASAEQVAFESAEEAKRAAHQARLANAAVDRFRGDNPFIRR
jgi:hypothetical protein